MFYSDPFDLSHQEAFVNRDQKITVDSWERLRCSGIEGNRLRRLNIKDYFDVVWRYEINRTDP